MDFQSVKTRFMGSYIFLLALFILHVPVIYYLAGGMSQKYSQVEEAGSLTKRAVELTEILNRHIMSGDDNLEREFVSKRQEYSKVIADLKNGTNEFEAIKDAEALDRLGAVEREWGGMQPVFDKALSAGNRLSKAKADVKGSTFPMIETLSRLANSTGGKASNGAALDRMRTVKLSYLLERYLVSFSDRDIVSTDIKATIAEFDDSIKELKATGSAYAVDAEGLWTERKERILEGVAANDSYYRELHSLVDVHTPRIVAAANELTREITRQARNSALRSIGIMVLSVIISACFAGFFMWLANNHLVKPIEKIKEAVEGLAKGNLTSRADVKVRFFGKEFNDEVASLGESTGSIEEHMSEINRNLTGSSHRLASGQLSDSSAGIYEGVDTQSKETAQVATAMVDMNATVVDVAKNSQEATETAQKTREIAKKGGLVVSEAITAMTDVEDELKRLAEELTELVSNFEAQEDAPSPGLRIIADNTKGETEQEKERFPKLVKNG